MAALLMEKRRSTGLGPNSDPVSLGAEGCRGRAPRALADRLPADDDSRCRDEQFRRAADLGDFHESVHGRPDPIRGRTTDDAHACRSFCHAHGHNLKAECMKARDEAGEGVTARLELDFQTMSHGVLQKQKTPAARRQQG